MICFCFSFCLLDLAGDSLPGGVIDLDGVAAVGSAGIVPPAGGQLAVFVIQGDAAIDIGEIPLFFLLVDIVAAAVRVGGVILGADLIPQGGGHLHLGDISRTAGGSRAGRSCSGRGGIAGGGGLVGIIGPAQSLSLIHI